MSDRIYGAIHDPLFLSTIHVFAHVTPSTFFSIYAKGDDAKQIINTRYRFKFCRSKRYPVETI